MKLPRFYPIIDTASAKQHGCGAVLMAEALLESGVKLLQFRHKDQLTRDIFREIETVARLARENGVLLIVNDRADIAKMVGAGVHVGQDDLSPCEVRTLLGPDAVVGFSTHNRSQLMSAAGEPITYAALGPVFDTPSKSNADAPLGVEELKALRALSPRPLVAIGGMTRTNARAVLDAGADAVAVIADLFPDSCDKASMRARAEEWIQVAGE